MKDLTAKLGKGGLILAALGIMSIVLSIFNYNIRLLAWIDLWGETMGWVIRITLIIIGALVYYFFGQDDEEVE